MRAFYCVFNGAAEFYHSGYRFEFCSYKSLERLILKFAHQQFNSGLAQIFSKMLETAQTACVQHINAADIQDQTFGAVETYNHVVEHTVGCCKEQRSVDLVDIPSLRYLLSRGGVNLQLIHPDGQFGH